MVDKVRIEKYIVQAFIGMLPITTVQCTIQRRLDTYDDKLNVGRLINLLELTVCLGCNRSQGPD